MTQITLFDGNKGGTGKSFAAWGYIDRLMSRGERPMVIETDTENPDIERTCKDYIDVERVNLGDKRGVMDLMDIIYENAGNEIVVSLPAGAGQTMRGHGDLLAETIQDLGCELVIYWLMNREADSVILLEEQMNSIVGQHASRVIAVRNGFFGSEDAFYRWEKSKMRKRFLETEGCSEVYLPQLHERVVYNLGVLPPHLALGDQEGLRYSDRKVLENWLIEMSEAFGL